MPISLGRPNYLGYPGCPDFPDCLGEADLPDFFSLKLFDFLCIERILPLLTHRWSGVILTFPHTHNSFTLYESRVILVEPLMWLDEIKASKRFVSTTDGSEGGDCMVDVSIIDIEVSHRAHGIRVGIE